jgi:hypothetical protein
MYEMSRNNEPLRMYETGWDNQLLGASRAGTRSSLTGAVLVVSAAFAGRLVCARHNVHFRFGTSRAGTFSSLTGAVIAN